MVYEMRYCINIFLSHFLYLCGISVAILFSGLAVPVPRISPWRQAVVPPPAVSGAWEAVEMPFFFQDCNWDRIGITWPVGGLEHQFYFP